ncbi:hypothetical protein CCR75_005039 [Bremia lactucae]|uniref:Uncharacterized protein n=1 Tax=Bremia lactucae TaxID=4779 RepID=A0A976IFA1_BRELC|nr:hypothetical protein CCR75_005039 [Bremia lactucae]
MDYSTEKEGIKRRKVMSTEVFETPELEATFQPYTLAHGPFLGPHGSSAAGPEADSGFHDKAWLLFTLNHVPISSMELDKQELPVAQAFEAFMGKIYKPNLPKQTEYESSSNRSSQRSILESPLARFTRLSIEMKELETDLTLLATDAEHKKQRLMVDAGQEAELTEVMQGLHTLQLNLSALEQNKAFQPFLGTQTRNADTAVALQKDLTAKFFKQIDVLKRWQEGIKADRLSDNASIIYEIYSNGELNAVDQDAKTRVATLEARISTLERAIGSFQGQELRLDGLNALSVASSANLTSSVTELEQRVALMSQKNLDAVKTRTTALIHEFTLLSKLKQSPSVQGALNSQADREQIQKIYDQLSSLDAVAASVPTIVDRLVTLKTVHDEALDVTTRVDKLEQTQASIHELLSSDNVLLANMEASLAENVQIFQSNIQQLDERMAKLLFPSGEHVLVVLPCSLPIPSFLRRMRTLPWGTMDYSTEKEGIKRRKVMSTEVFETPELEATFQPYTLAHGPFLGPHGSSAAGPEADSGFHDKAWLLFTLNHVPISSMELDKQELPVAQAFEAFMGKIYKPNLPKQTEYESSSSQSSQRSILESPLARFTRLSIEMKELETDLTLLATDAEHKKQRLMVDAGQEAELTEVMQGLHTLQLNLSALEQNKAFQPFLGTQTRNADTAVALQKDLTAKFFKQIDVLKRRQEGIKADRLSDNASIIYEIYSNGELNAVDQDAKTRVATLEARISTLERAIGSFQGQELRLDGLNALSEASSANLTSSVTELEQRVALMSQKNLDAVKTRTTALIHEFTLLSKLKQSPSVQGALNSQADREQIQKIYDQLSSLDAVAASVPTIVDRLVTLKTVHDEALDVTTRVDKLEQTQGSIHELLSSDNVLLANMEASLAENVQIFQSNIQQLDERMAKLLFSSS